MRPYRGSTFGNTISLRDALAIDMTSIDEREEEKNNVRIMEQDEEAHAEQERPVRESNDTFASSSSPGSSPFKGGSDGRLSSSTSRKHEIEHVEESVPGVTGDTSWAEIKADAERSEALEHSLSVREALRIYKAVSCQVTLA